MAAQQPSTASSSVGQFAPARLPIAQVALFSSGVGYFQREGTIEGNARVDLAFSSGDVNDLLKSLVLQDGDGGHVRMISYDSHDPVGKALKSFALDLTNNPTFGQILNQARGEKVEVTIQQTNTYPAGSLTGVIIGMETLRRVGDLLEIDMLNLLTSEGIRSVPLLHIQRVRFLNPALEADLKRALDVLASVHDSRKKTVSINFSGAGKRSVKLGYVIENPIWKASYRLVLDQNGKALLQGWALVENSGEDDWENVRMVLVSGRPISYQMDLYQPLYVPRPNVEPELFASLRPPTYTGALAGAGGLGGIGGLGGGAPQVGPATTAGQAFEEDPRGIGQALTGNRYQLGGSLGFQGGDASPRLSYEGFQRREQAKQKAREQAKIAGAAMADLQPSQGFAAVASGAQSGDSFQYIIDHRLSLPRQKSAMLPIANTKVEATKVSIFNEAVHAEFPLLGVRFKNTSNQHLMQGPITIYDDGRYAGDSRILDLQPNEERLLSYAVDLGTEVKAETQRAPEMLASVRIVRGLVSVGKKQRLTTNYAVRNRSEHERTLLIEHPMHADWKLAKPARPSEQSRDVYRFKLELAAGHRARLEVVEDHHRFDEIVLTSADEDAIQSISQGGSTRVRDALKKAIDLKAALTTTQGQRVAREHQLRAIADDQSRLRANLGKVPSDSAAYKRYLEKFDTQETEIERLQERIRLLRATEVRQRKEYEDYLQGLSVE
jgi:hypothetical protein